MKYLKKNWVGEIVLFLLIAGGLGSLLYCLHLTQVRSRENQFGGKIVEIDQGLGSKAIFTAAIGNPSLPPQEGRWDLFLKENERITRLDHLEPNTREEVLTLLRRGFPVVMKKGALEEVVPVELPVLDINNPILTQSARLPDGDIHLKKAIKATNLEKIHLVGGNRSRIFWEGDDPDGAIQYIGVRKGSIGGEGTLGFEIICSKAGCNAAILIANSPVVGGFISSGIQVRNVHIRHGGSQVAFDKGFSIDSYRLDPTGVGHGHANNENHRFFNCSVESCMKAAFHVRGYQSYDISFRDCDGLDAGRVVSPNFATKELLDAWLATSEYKNNHYVVSSLGSWRAASRAWIYGVWIETGASVILKNCNFNRCEWDVFMGWPCSRCTFEGHNSEHSRGLVSNRLRDPVTGIYAAATSSDYYVHGRDIRFDCEPRDNVPVVYMWGRGPTTFTNCFFSGINGVCPRIECENYAKKIDGVWIPLKGRLDIEDVTFGQHGGRLPKGPIIKTPANWSPRTSLVEHKYMNPDGIWSWRPVIANQLLGPIDD